MPRAIGPLEEFYDPIGLPFRLRCGHRVAQLIVTMKPLYAAGDGIRFASHLPELRTIYDALHEPGWADTLFDVLWPDWKQYDR